MPAAARLPIGVVIEQSLIASRWNDMIDNIGATLQSDCLTCEAPRVSGLEPCRHDFPPAIVSALGCGAGRSRHRFLDRGGVWAAAHRRDVSVGGTGGRSDGQKRTSGSDCAEMRTKSDSKNDYRIRTDASAKLIGCWRNAEVAGGRPTATNAPYALANSARNKPGPSWYGIPYRLPVGMRRRQEYPTF